VVLIEISSNHKGGVVFLSSHNKIHDTHTSRERLLNSFPELLFIVSFFSKQNEVWAGARRKVKNTSIKHRGEENINTNSVFSKKNTE
jgi:hypothetical protein